MEEELAQTIRGLHDLTLRVEASERCVRLVLPAVLLVESVIIINLIVSHF